MTYRPLPEHLTIKESTIEGLGLYSTESLTQARFLGVSHVPNDKFENGYIRTPLGGFINHSEEPNCEVREDVDGNLMLFTLRPILPNEELTLKYNLYKVH
jgi:SET domain-containing protein